MAPRRPVPPPFKFSFRRPSGTRIEGTMGLMLGLEILFVGCTPLARVEILRRLQAVHDDQAAKEAAS